MKIKKLFIVLFLAVTGTLQAQEHLPESNSLVGMWRLVGMTRNQSGETVAVKTGNYKVINPDGTFYVFITWGARNQNPQNDITAFNLYGTYTITSDSTYTEHIVKIDGNPGMNNSDSEMKYKFAPGSDNNVVYLMWKNSALNRWIPELWERVIFPQRDKETQNI